MNVAFDPIDNSHARGPLQGKVIVVTGGARGLGASISAHCIQEGATVVLVGRNLDRLSAHSANLGKSASFVAVDLTDPGSAQLVIDETVSRYGALHGLVNNAGSAHFAPVETISARDFDKLFSLDVRAPLMLIGAATSVMPPGSSIVNLSSAMSAIGQPGTSAYAASKGALDAATRTLAAELGPRGIRVNGVRPGLTRTDATEYAYADAPMLDRYRRTVPLGRTGTVDEVARAIVFLLSSESEFTTGQILAVDGGHSTSNMALFNSDEQLNA